MDSETTSAGPPRVSPALLAQQRAPAEGHTLAAVASLLSSSSFWNTILHCFFLFHAWPCSYEDCRPIIFQIFPQFLKISLNLILGQSLKENHTSGSVLLLTNSIKWCMVLISITDDLNFDHEIKLTTVSFLLQKLHLTFPFIMNSHFLSNYSESMFLNHLLWCFRHLWMSKWAGGGRSWLCLWTSPSMVEVGSTLWEVYSSFCLCFDCLLV